jgi:hypothetical protein
LRECQFELQLRHSSFMVFFQFLQLNAKVDHGNCFIFMFVLTECIIKSAEVYHCQEFLYTFTVSGDFPVYHRKCTYNFQVL